MSEQATIAIIGAGVVGLAIARAAALAGHAPLLLEQHATFGQGISSRNSEVIHAGLYYSSGSLKARACVAGRAALYRYCADHHIPHNRIGKLVVAATPEEAALLDQIESRARACGVDDLMRLDAPDTRRLEPELACHQAILSPSTGIVDSHALMLQMLADMENAGGLFVPHTAVTRLAHGPQGWAVHVNGLDEPALIAAHVVNAAGLEAHRLARRTDGLAPEVLPHLRSAKGHYFTYAGRVPFSRLIYPVPVPGGLGTHLTLDLAGQARFGPDVEWLEPSDDPPDFAANPARKPGFMAAAQRIWPALDADRLHPGYAGIRPKLSGPGEPAADFRVDGPEAHGLPGLVNLFGIESPGLTASMALADLVLEKLGIAP